LSRSHSPRLDVDGTVEVFCGVDVARETHHAVAVDRSGRSLADRALPNDEAALRKLFTELAEHGRLLVVVDQPASIGALAIAVARSMGVQVGYLPGLAMRRIADLYPGEGKTDARDAFVIADAARTLPHALRRAGPDEQTVTALGVLAGYDADLAAEATRLTNRLHDALLHVHPALERLLGKHFRRRGILELLAAAGTPTRLRALGEDGLRAAMIARSPRIALALPPQILAALDEQTVVVPATEQYGRVISGLCCGVVSRACSWLGFRCGGRRRGRSRRRAAGAGSATSTRPSEVFFDCGEDGSGLLGSWLMRAGGPARQRRGVRRHRGVGR
jgi:Transposase